MALSGFGANKLFEGIPPAQVEALALAPRAVEVRRGTIIFEEGDPAEAMFLIGHGRVQISKRGRGGKQETLTWLERNDFFGEMALYDPAPRSARATAAEDTILGRVGLAEFQSALEHAPPRLHLNLTRWTIRRLRENDHLLIDQLLAAERLSLVGSMAAMIRAHSGSETAPSDFSGSPQSTTRVMPSGCSSVGVVTTAAMMPALLWPDARSTGTRAPVSSRSCSTSVPPPASTACSS